jgi:hypothetical protein
LKEYQTNKDSNWINLPTAMTSTNYIIVDGRKGYNLHDTTGWLEKKTDQFYVDPESAHITDFLIIGY